MSFDYQEWQGEEDREFIQFFGSPATVIEPQKTVLDEATQSNCVLPPVKRTATVTVCDQLVRQESNSEIQVSSAEIEISAVDLGEGVVPQPGWIVVTDCGSWCLTERLDCCGGGVQLAHRFRAKPGTA